MNIEKRILHLITFILVVSFFYEIISFSNHQPFQFYVSEISTSENTIEPNGFSAFDFIEDIQIAKEELYNINLVSRQSKELFKRAFFVFLHPSFAIWQPPRLI